MWSSATLFCTHPAQAYFLCSALMIAGCRPALQGQRAACFPAVLPHVAAAVSSRHAEALAVAAAGAGTRACVDRRPHAHDCVPVLVAVAAEGCGSAEDASSTGATHVQVRLQCMCAGRACRLCVGEIVLWLHLAASAAAGEDSASGLKVERSTVALTNCLR